MILSFSGCAAAAFSASAEQKRIVIDAGHGGIDSGALGKNGTREDGINLSISKKLETILTDEGYTVIMTRENESAPAGTKKADMQKRREVIRGAGQLVTVSIHQNFYDGNSPASGPQVFFAPGSDEGERLADCIQARLNEALLPEKPREAHEGDYFIVRSGSAPAVIVECGFLSDPEEEELLKKSQYQVRIARAVSEGINDYLDDQIL